MSPYRVRYIGGVKTQKSFLALILVRSVFVVALKIVDFSRVNFDRPSFSVGFWKITFQLIGS